MPQDVRKIATLRQDARDAEYPALASGRNAGGSDAESIFADGRRGVLGISLESYRGFGPLLLCQ